MNYYYRVTASNGCSHILLANSWNHAIDKCVFKELEIISIERLDDIPSN